MKIKRDVMTESRSRIQQVSDYIKKNRKKVNYQLICRCAKALNINRAMVVDALNAMGMR